MSLKDKLIGNNPTPLTPETMAPEAEPPKSELNGKVKVNGPGMSMADRIRQANKMAKMNPSPLILNAKAVALLLDDSSSMRELDGDTETKSYRLNEGVQLFAHEVDFNQTKIITIPMNGNQEDFTTMNDIARYRTNASGGTPMDTCIEKFGNSEAQQGILISDGEANVSGNAIQQAHIIAEQRKRLDCVHIGSSFGGEKTLKQIAEITGGMFFKFKDVASFAASLKQLAPKNRAQLASKSAEEIKFLTGASEVIK